MTVEESIRQVTEICKENHVEQLQEQVDDIMTLKKIDLFEYDLCQNQYLKEDMDRYGRKIY